MKNYSTVEFWFACILGAVTAAESYPLVWFGQHAYASPSHSAALEWGAWVGLALFFLITSSCFGWELLLLHMRRRNPAASATTPTVVFCAGLVAALLTVGWWSIYYS